MREDITAGFLAITFFAATAIIVAGVLFSIAGAVNTIEFNARLASIEQLRDDSRALDPTQAEDVIGQITSTNIAIRRMQAYNNLPFICLAIPNGWDHVNVIPVPKTP